MMDNQDFKKLLEERREQVREKRKSVYSNHTLKAQEELLDELILNVSTNVSGRTSSRTAENEVEVSVDMGVPEGDFSKAQIISGKEIEAMADPDPPPQFDESALKATITPRSFVRIDFVDRYDNNCSIQKSSLATEDAIWLGVNEHRMHLTQPFVREHLLPILEIFARTGDINEDFNSNCKLWTEEIAKAKKRGQSFEGQPTGMSLSDMMTIQPPMKSPFEVGLGRKQEEEEGED